MNKEEGILMEVNTPLDDDRAVYISGGFCNWNPQSENHRLNKIGDNKYAIKLPKNDLVDFNNEYKYTKGGWENVELDVFGNLPVNRKLETYNKATSDFVPLWKKHGSTPFFKDTMPIIEILSEEFYIPQLKKYRKVTILLPADYYKNSIKNYPVVYMNDAQNLYGDGSPYGNWEIDKRLSLLKKHQGLDVIIVAIDHGEETRQEEYSPYKTNIKGQGMRYATFIVRNLKPLIDSTYRTLPDRQFTGIGGSSMGGLISIYTGMMYPETIGRLMVFSPSLWSAPKIYFDAVEFFNPLDTKIYIYGGGNESETMLPNIEKLKSTIESQGFATTKLQIKAEVDPKGEHNENRWGQEFPKAVNWLFEKEIKTENR